jgi:hypothetical protein
MKLANLNPKIEERKVLVCDCPCGGKHKLRLTLGTDRDEWTATGQLSDLTVKPSIVCDCWRGFITNGEIVTA